MDTIDNSTPIRPSAARSRTRTYRNGHAHNVSIASSTSAISEGLGMGSDDHQDGDVTPLRAGRGKEIDLIHRKEDGAGYDWGSKPWLAGKENEDDDADITPIVIERKGSSGMEKHRPPKLNLFSSTEATPTNTSLLENPHEQNSPQILAGSLSDSYRNANNHNIEFNTTQSTSESDISNHDQHLLQSLSLSHSLSRSTTSTSPNLASTSPQPLDSPLTHQLFLANETVEHLARCLGGLKVRAEGRDRVRVRSRGRSESGSQIRSGSRLGSMTSLLSLKEISDGNSSSARLDGLGILQDGQDNTVTRRGAEDGWRCCCEATVGGGSEEVGDATGEERCLSREWREGLEEELRLSGEIGQALLSRYSALLAKHTSTNNSLSSITTRLSETSSLLSLAYSKESKLEKALDSSMKKYTETIRKNEGLEKRLGDLEGSLILSGGTVNSLRKELVSMKNTKTHAKNLSTSLEIELMDLKRVEVSLREDLEVAQRGRKEEERKRRAGERRLMDMEGRLRDLVGELKGEKEGRKRDQGNLLGSAKEKLEELVEQLHAPTSEDDPDIQRALSALVSDNTLLRHDAHSLTLQLSESRARVLSLEQEADDMRMSMGIAPRTPMMDELHTHPTADSSFSEEEAGSSRGGQPTLSAAEERKRKRHSIAVMAPPKGSFVPRPLSLSISVRSNVSSGGATGHDRHQSLTPSLAASVISSSNRAAHLHGRNDSLTPSMGSNNALSPRSSAAVAALGPSYPRTELESPVQVTSPGVSTQQSYFGARPRMPANPRSLSGGHPHRSMSIDRRPGSSRKVSGVSSIGEEEQNGPHPVTSSPGAVDSLAGTSYRGKRTSFLGSSTYRRPAPSHSGEDSLDAISAPPSATISEPHFGLERKATIGRKPLLLLSTSSKAVQTDDMEEPVAPSTSFSGRLRTLAEKPSQSSLHSTASFGKSSVRGLGFEHEMGMSTGSGPQLNDHQSETSSYQDPRTAGLTLLIDHMTKLLVKLRQSDVPSLTRRLKKQHLAGDVGYLSQSTLKGLSSEVNDMKMLFKAALDEEKKTADRARLGVAESAITRKDLASLLRLFKEVFGELVDLRGTVNQVILEPSHAQKLKAAMDALDDDDRGRPAAPKQTPSGGGLGWIAPISKLFATQPVLTPDAGKTAFRANSGMETPRVVSAAKGLVPKLVASTSATTTHVNVEFAGAGVVRRATSAMPVQSADILEGLPDSPSESMMNRGPATRIPLGRSGPAITWGDGTIRGGSSAYKPALMGIFAGASTRPSGSAWPHGDGTTGTMSSKRLRTKTSQVFGAEKDPAGFVSGRTHKRQISVAVDAVIDTALPEHVIGNSDRIEEEPIMQRTLRGRPRGLSDSSIRSTFVSQGASTSTDALREDTINSTTSGQAAIPAMSRTTTLATDADAPIASFAETAASYWPRNNSVMRKLGRGLGVIPPKVRAESAASKDSNDGTSSQDDPTEPVLKEGPPETSSSRLAVHIVPPTMRSVSSPLNIGHTPIKINSGRSASRSRGEFRPSSAENRLGTSSGGEGRSYGSDKYLGDGHVPTAGMTLGGSARLISMFAGSGSAIDEEGNIRHFV